MSLQPVLPRLGSAKVSDRQSTLDLLLAWIPPNWSSSYGTSNAKYRDSDDKIQEHPHLSYATQLMRAYST